MFRKILHYPAEPLKTWCDEYTEADFENRQLLLVSLATDLIDTCNVVNGAGLAANQIGVCRQMVVIKPSAFGLENPETNGINDDYLVIINPKIILQGEDKQKWSEQCLSVPNLDVNIVRHENIVLQYKNLKGETQYVKAGWPFSGGIQHECDHILGHTVLDKVDKKLKSFYIKRYYKRNK